MKLYLTIILGLISISGLSQTKLEINGFSEKYKGVLTIEEGFEDEIFKKGNISIIELKTNKKVIDINSDEFTFDLNENRNVKTNVLEAPYGEQSIIISKDFNFDGIEDLAVMDGQYSCYNGPSYQVYLEIDDKLEFSPGFTQLAQQYCGMFQIDDESKTIHTITKSGCCWHQFSTFKVVNNIPEPILVIEKDAMNIPYYTETITEWNNSEKTRRVEKTVDLMCEEVTEVFSFELVKNQKKVVIFNFNEGILNYVLMKPDETVEFAYPIKIVHKNPDFEIDEAKENLVFRNQGVVYKVYETQNQDGTVKIGVIVQVDGKSYNLKGDPETINGSLANVKKANLYNVITK